MRTSYMSLQHPSTFAFPIVIRSSDRARGRCCGHFRIRAMISSSYNVIVANRCRFLFVLATVFLICQYIYLSKSVYNVKIFSFRVSNHEYIKVNIGTTINGSTTPGSVHKLNDPEYAAASYKKAGEKSDQTPVVLSSSQEPNIYVEVVTRSKSRNLTRTKSLLDKKHSKVVKPRPTVAELVSSLFTTVMPVAVTTLFHKASSGKVPICPLVPPVLVGPIKVWFDRPTMKELKQLYPNLSPGGHGRPAECTSRHRVAIIIPYRDRADQLRIFLHNMHSLLRKQQLDYGIFIVEQVENQLFNRAKLMNIGFVEASKRYDWQCYIFHDVDLLPEDDRNLYSCPQQPRHMSVAVDTLGYRLPYTDIFGGITALTKGQFEQMNGFSNAFWGWGGEDDEMASRVKINGFKISRYKNDIARYKMIRHSRERSNPVNECRYSLMYKVRQRWKSDGLSSLNYKLIDSKMNHLYAWYKVDLLEEESLNALENERICKSVQRFH